jgi:hypothetical protein
MFDTGMPSSGNFSDYEKQSFKSKSSPLISKNPWGWHPGAETCRRLTLVVNCILLTALVAWCINYKNMGGKGKIIFNICTSKS